MHLCLTIAPPIASFLTAGSLDFSALSERVRRWRLSEVAEWEDAFRICVAGRVDASQNNLIPDLFVCPSTIPRGGHNDHVFKLGCLATSSSTNSDCVEQAAGE